MWHMRVDNFAAIVTMDAHGNSLHADVEAATGAALEELQPGIAATIATVPRRLSAAGSPGPTPRR